MLNMSRLRAMEQGPGFSPFRFFKRVVVLAFALIQLLLVARILLDLGVIPPEGSFGEFIVQWSDILAAPVEGLGDSLFGGVGGLGLPLPGEGFNPVMIAALIGWSLVEGLVMRAVNKLAAV